MYCDYHGGKFIDEYKDYDKAQCVPVLPPNEQIAKCAAALKQLAQNMINILLPAIEKMVSTLVPIVKEFGEKMFNSYPNKRVVYLALHHRKHRVRKKNINRIMKWIEREGNK